MKNTRLPGFISRFLPTLSLVFVLLLGAAIRLSSLQYGYQHPDEIISVKVSERVVAQKNLDTNWELADLPAYFKYPQYNFSGYLLSTSGILALAHSLPVLKTESTLQLLRVWSCALGLAVIGLMYLVGRQLFGAPVGLCAALLGGINPLLYQDSLYARPETFVAALTLLLVFIPGRFTQKIKLGWFLASLIMGILIATKVSILVLLPFLFFPLEKNELGKIFIDKFNEYLKQVVKFFPVAAITVLPGTFLGLLLAAPYAFIHREKFTSGIEVLKQQYGGGHWPHGLPDGTLFERLSYAASYFYSTMGIFIFLFSLIGAGYALRQQKFRAVFLFTFILIFSIWFGSYPAFFERNFSHILPLLLIFSAYGIVQFAAFLHFEGGMKYAFLCTMLAVTAWPSLSISLRLRFDEVNGSQLSKLTAVRQKVESSSGLTSASLNWTKSDEEFKNNVHSECQSMLVEFPYAGDRYALQVIRKLKENEGWREVGRFNSIFSDVPPSTLQTYFTPTKFFLAKDIDITTCKINGEKYFPKNSLKNTLNVMAVTKDLAWTRSGAYGSILDPFGSKDYLGSWSGSDANTGNLRFEAVIEGEGALILPYMTGPKSENQTILVRDAVSNHVIWRNDASVKAQNWYFPLVHLPPGTQKIRVEASDNGSGWGEWQALAFPRFFKPD